MESNMTAYWSECYVEKNLFWQLETPNPILVDYLEELTEGQKKKFFMPLSGKSRDLHFLISQGHQVFAVEGVAKAIEELNEDLGLGLKFKKEESVYESGDGKLRIYCGDFRKCPIEKFGPFDCVWDRAAFTAIDFELRPAYADMMRRALVTKNMDHKFRYLLEVVDYDRTKFDEAPRPVSESEMQELFGQWAKFEVVHGKQFHPDVERVVQKVSTFKPDEVTQVLYLLTPKSK